MSDPRDIRRMVGEIRGALDAQPREALVEILTYVFKEYVVEGAAPLASGAGAILDARSELDGLNFAQVVTWLQSHLDHPELRLLEVAGDRVSVRIAGRSFPLEVQAQPEPLPPPRAAVAAPAAAPAANAAPMPVTPTPSVATTRAPAPPTSAAPTAAPAAPAAPNNAAPQQPSAAQPAAKDEATSEAQSRFSLLEVD